MDGERLGPKRIGMERIWLGLPTQIYWGANMPGAQNKGSYKGGKSPESWPNLRGDPGGKAYAKSDWATKTTEGSTPEQMPL